MQQYKVSVGPGVGAKQIDQYARGMILLVLGESNEGEQHRANVGGRRACAYAPRNGQ